MPAGTAASNQVAGDCKFKACDGGGGIIDKIDDNDVGNDSNPCTIDGCSNGTPTHVSQVGHACSFSGGKVCDSIGACVECLQPSDCGTPANAPCVVATCSADHHCGTANAPPTTDCGQGPSCGAPTYTAHFQDKCSGGTCVSGGDQPCFPFLCAQNVCSTGCGFDFQCATTYQCDEDLGDCIPETMPKCSAYCDKIQPACVGANQQYPSTAECLHSCVDLPRDASTSGNTVGCRSAQAGLAISDPGRCPQAGPAGDGTCGTNCESFCSLASKACVGNNQQFADPTDCAAKCALFGNVSDRYTTAAVTGDTFACRMYHLTLATVDPATHCPHIAPVSSVCH
jgi:hypothetical protein